MVNLYFTNDSLKEILGPDKMNQLLNCAIDKGAAFLSGQTTSAMNKVSTDSTVGSALLATETGLGLATNASNLATSNLIPNLAKDIISGAAAKTTQLVGEEMGKIAMYAMTAPTTIPSKIQLYAKNYFNANKTTLAKELEALGSDPEEISAKESEKNNQNKLNETVGQIGAKINDVKSVIDKNLNVVNEQLGKISGYIEEGPEMIVKEVNDIISFGVDFARKEVNNQIAEIDNRINTFCKTEGEKIGVEMVGKYNKTIRDQALKIKNQQKQQITKAAAMAFKAKQKGILAIMSMTGVNIPIPLG